MSEMAVSEMADGATPPAKTVVLPATKQARAWIREFDAMIAAVEAEELAAVGEYEDARARCQEAIQQAHLVRQLRALVTVADGPPSPGPTMARYNVRWARDHDACTVCGETERQHSSHGRCTRCAVYRRTTGRERPRGLEAIDGK